MYGKTGQTVGPGFETEDLLKTVAGSQKRVLLYLGNRT